MRLPKLMLTTFRFRVDELEVDSTLEAVWMANATDSIIADRDASRSLLNPDHDNGEPQFTATQSVSIASSSGLSSAFPSLAASSAVPFLPPVSEVRLLPGQRKVLPSARSDHNGLPTSCWRGIISGSCQSQNFYDWLCSRSKPPFFSPVLCIWGFQKCITSTRRVLSSPNRPF